MKKQPHSTHARSSYTEEPDSFSIKEIEQFVSEMLLLAEKKAFDKLLTLEKTLVDPKSHLSISFFKLKEKFEKNALLLSIEKNLVKIYCLVLKSVFLNRNKTYLILQNQRSLKRKGSYSDAIAHAQLIIGGWKYLKQAQKHPQYLVKQYTQQRIQHSNEADADKMLKEIENTVLKFDLSSINSDLFNDKNLQDEINEDIIFLKTMRFTNRNSFSKKGNLKNITKAIERERNDQPNKSIILENKIKILDLIYQNQLNNTDPMTRNEFYRRIIVPSHEALRSVIVKIDHNAARKLDITGRFIVLASEESTIEQQIKIRNYLYDFYQLLLSKDNLIYFKNNKNFKLAENLKFPGGDPAFYGIKEATRNFCLYYITPLELFSYYKEMELGQLENEAILIKRSAEKLKEEDLGKMSKEKINNALNELIIKTKIIGHLIDKKKSDENSQRKQIRFILGEAETDIKWKKRTIKRLNSILDLFEEVEKLKEKQKPEEDRRYYNLLIALAYNTLSTKKEEKKYTLSIFSELMKFILRKSLLSSKEITKLLELKSKVTYSIMRRDHNSIQRKQKSQQLEILNLINGDRRFSAKSLRSSYSNILINIIPRLAFGSYVIKNKKKFLELLMKDETLLESFEKIEKIVKITSAFLSVNLNLPDLYSSQEEVLDDSGKENSLFCSFKQVAELNDTITFFLDNFENIEVFIDPSEAKKIIRNNLEKIQKAYFFNQNWVSTIDLSDHSENEIKKIQEEIYSLIKEGDERKNTDTIREAEEKLIKLHLQIRGDLPFKESLPNKEILETLSSENQNLAELIIQIKHYEHTGIILQIAGRNPGGKQKNSLESFKRLKDEITLFESYSNSVKLIEKIIEDHKLTKRSFPFFLNKPIEASEIMKLVHYFDQLKILFNSQQRNECIKKRLELIEAFLKQGSLCNLMTSSGKKVKELLNDSFTFFTSPIQYFSASSYLKSIKSDFLIKGIIFYDPTYCSSPPLASNNNLEDPHLLSEQKEEEKEELKEEKEKEEDKRDILTVSQNRHLLLKTGSEKPLYPLQEKMDPNAQQQSSQACFSPS